MNGFTTISEIVAALDRLVQECMHSQSRAGYFAALYKRVTVAVSEGITKSSFEDGRRMEALDVVFAGRYLDAFASFQKGRPCSGSWQCAFTGCGQESLTVLQQLILGINTHINLDLAIAAATVAPGEAIHALETDFNRINGVIASLVDDVQRCLESVWFPMRWLNRIATKPEEAVLNFSIGVARKTAWANAVLLAGMSSAQQTAHVETMDAMVQKIGDAVIHPGLWPQFLLRLVRLTEYGDVARTIRLIDTTVVE